MAKKSAQKSVKIKERSNMAKKVQKKVQKIVTQKRIHKYSPKIVSSGSSSQ